MNLIRKMLMDWRRYLGILLIIMVSAFFLLLSVTQRNANNSNNLVSNIASYTAFIENWFYDIRSNFQYHHGKKDQNIVVAAIDEESLQKIGRWPWSRAKIAQVIEKLEMLGAKVIAFDIIFAEPEGNSDNPNSPDKKMSAAIQNFQNKGGKVILSYSVVSKENEYLKEIPTELYFSVIDGGTNGRSIPPLNYVSKENFPIPELVGASPVLGFLDNEPDRDGVFRHAKVIADIDNTLLPSLGMAMFKGLFQVSKDHKVNIAPSSSSLDFELSIQSPEMKQAASIPINGRGEVKVRFLGGENNFEKISIHKILSANENSELKQLFKNKAVIIGSTALGAFDLRHTPVDPVLPGLYIHTNVFHMLTEKYFFKNDDTTLPVSIAFLLLGSLILTLLSFLNSPIIDIGANALIGILIFYIDRIFFIPKGYALSLFASYFCFGNITVWTTLLNVYREAKERKKVRSAFGRYVSPAIVKQMLANPDQLTLGGEKKEITMMFSDIRDFTSISEKLSPQDLAGLLNFYMSKMTDILFESQGTLDKYIGDAMVCFWGAPVDLPNHPFLAVEASLKMIETLPEVNRELQSKKLPAVSIGLGINTGEVSVGNMGSDKIFAYTALGDNMNLASRLEGLTKHYGAQLVISEFTYERLGEQKNLFKTRPLDMVQVKGKSKAVKIFEVLPKTNALHDDSETLSNYQEAYNCYLKRNFSKAKSLLEAILVNYPKDKASKNIKEACDNFIQNPPPEDWQGVTIFTTK